jgi:O-antigen/teichoic acid export membrane protein
VIVLTSGTAIAQAIPLAIMPFLTRVYTPSEFAVLASFTALASVLAVVVAARYELTIMQAKDAVEANHRAVLSLFAIAVSAVLWGVVMAFFSPTISSVMGQPALQPWLIWLPLPLMMMGVVQTFSSWLNFHKRYRDIAIGRVAQATMTAAINIGGGVWKSGAVGLLLGYVAGLACAALYFWRKASLRWRDMREANIPELARRYADYPLFSAPAALLDVASSYAVIFIIGSFYSAEILGQFFLAHRLLLVPMILVGAGVAQVFFQHAVECRNRGVSLRPILINTSRKLLLYSFPLFVLFVIFAPTLFAFALGETWRTAGEFARIVAFGYWVRLAVSPVSTVFLALDRLKTGTLWQVAYFVASYGVLGAAAWLHVPITQFLLLYMVEEFMLYSLYFVMAYRACDQTQLSKAV